MDSASAKSSCPWAGLSREAVGALMAGLSQTAPFSSFLCFSFTVWAPLRAPPLLCGGFCPCPGAGESCHTPKVILPVQG